MLVRYFASLREQRGSVWQELLQDNRRLQIAVNQDLARRNSAIKSDDEIAFFPPVTGG